MLGYIPQFEVESLLTNLESNLMNVRKTFDDLIHFISGAVARIFGPTDDQYPATGVQPFEGDVRPSRSHDW